MSTSTEGATPIGRAKKRVRDQLRDNDLKNGWITEHEYRVALEALDRNARQLRNIERAAA